MLILNLFKKREINIASLFMLIFPGTFFLPFMKMDCRNNFYFPFLFFSLSKHSDNYRNKEVCVEIQRCFPQTLLVMEFSNLIEHLNFAKFAKSHYLSVKGMGKKT